MAASTAQINKQTFSREEIEKGVPLKLLDYLLKHNVDLDVDESDNFDIRISSDGETCSIEWVNTAYDGEYQLVDEEHVVLKEVIFPDNTIEYLPDDEEDEAFNNWLKDHPTYVKSPITGHWYDKEEYKDFHPATSLNDFFPSNRNEHELDEAASTWKESIEAEKEAKKEAEKEKGEK